MEINKLLLLRFISAVSQYLGKLTYEYFYSFDAASINVLVTGSFSRFTQGEGD